MAAPSPARRLLAIATLAGAALFATAVQGATFRVDDSGSLPGDATVNMKWQSMAPTRSASHLVEGSTLVTIRLNVAPWLNKAGKIYMALPVQATGQITAEWATQGVLLPGQLASGTRTLVYAGPIRQPRLEDTIALRILADGRRLEAPQRLQFYFEIDVD